MAAALQNDADAYSHHETCILYVYIIDFFCDYLSFISRTNMYPEENITVICKIYNCLSDMIYYNWEYIYEYIQLFPSTKVLL